MGKIAASVLRRGLSMVMKYATPLTPLYLTYTKYNPCSKKTRKIYLLLEHRFISQNE